MIRGISHVALTVEDVSSAEGYYCGLFGLEVAFRDAQHGGRQASLRPGVSWETATSRGVAPGLSSLFRGGFTLALEQGVAAGPGRLNHIGLDVDQSEIEQLGSRVAAHKCRVVAERSDLLVFEDLYGTHWELTTRTYASAAEASTGHRLGEWLDLTDPIDDPGASQRFA